MWKHIPNDEHWLTFNIEVISVSLTIDMTFYQLGHYLITDALCGGVDAGKAVRIHEFQQRQLSYPSRSMSNK